MLVGEKVSYSFSDVETLLRTLARDRCPSERATWPLYELD